MLRERIGRLYYRLAYRGRPRWDTGTLPEALAALVEGRRAGRLLDLGCGTGAAAVRLAESGWQVTGIDYVPAAVVAARRRAAESGVAADFRVGDVTHLDQLVDGCRYDLVFDAGCYHGLSEPGRERYASGVARVAAPGAELLLLGFHEVPLSWRLIGAPGSGTADVPARFAPWFTVEERGMETGRRLRMEWLRLRRRGDVTA
ncbi:MAG TPA: methyltransferase domain-containing protein [Candidatus Binatia bacterium]|nr:methyltransferase domain-containing protein [Candidatus Binatia bacterium]